MPKLADEDGFRESIRSTLKADFDVARRLLKVAMWFFTGPREPVLCGGVDEVVVMVSFGIFAKMCKQYRGIIALSELGLGKEASCLSRMLFESMLAIQFILRRKVNLRGLAPVPGKPLSSRFRCDLYIANHGFQITKNFRLMCETPGFKRIATKKEKQAAAAEVSRWEGIIGTEWTERLKKKGYAGMSVENLAYSLHFRSLYNELYRSTSIGVHGADGPSYFSIEDRGDGIGRAVFEYLPSADGIPQNIRMSNFMLAHSMDVINKRMKFGVERTVLRLIDATIALGVD